MDFCEETRNYVKNEDPLIFLLFLIFKLIGGRDPEKNEGGKEASPFASRKYFKTFRISEGDLTIL